MSWLAPSDEDRRYVERLKQEGDGLFSLLGVLSLALWIEPLLLRNARILFTPNADIEIENAIWFSSIMHTRNAKACVMRSGVARALADDFFKEDSDHFRDSWQFVQMHTRHWSPKDQLEQELRLAIRNDDNQALEEGFNRVLRTLLDTNDPAQKRDLSRWAKGAMTSLVKHDETSETAHLLFQYVAATLGLPVSWSAQTHSDKAAMPQWLAKALPKYKENSLGIQFRVGVMECIDPDVALHQLNFHSPLPVPVLMSVNDNAEGRWESLWLGKIIAIPKTITTLTLQTLEGKRYRFLLKNDDDKTRVKDEPQPAPFQLVYMPDDLELARQLAIFLKQHGIDVELTTDQVTPNMSSILDERPLLRLWTKTSSDYWRQLQGHSEVRASETILHGLLLRVDPNVQLPTNVSSVQPFDLFDLTSQDTEQLASILQNWQASGVLEVPTASPAYMPIVYLCYVKEDHELAQKMDRSLTGKGIFSWQFNENIRLGANLDKQLEYVIHQRVDYVIVVQTPAMAKKDEGLFYREINFALERQHSLTENQQFIIPITLSKDSVLTILQNWNAQLIDPDDGFEKSMTILADTILSDWQLRVTDTDHDRNELDKLQEELNNPDTRPSRRLQIGDRLAELGDPRKGVGVREFELVSNEEDLAFKAHIEEIHSLVTELRQPSTKPLRRLDIGNRLADLGDIRPGVGLNDQSLPDIDWVEIPAGPFIYGKGKDQKTIELESYYTSRYLITNQQFQAFIDAEGYHEEKWWQGLEKSEPVEPRSKQPNRPREKVSWFEAVAFTRWMTVQMGYKVFLPTEQQWEKAARGKNGFAYPWGNVFQSGLANINETRDGKGAYNLGETTAVGLYPHGSSPYGIADMAGNVWEWCLNQIDKPDIVKIDSSGESRVVRGGSWLLDVYYANCAIRDWGAPNDRFEDIGFRVVSSSPFPDH